MPRPEPRSRRPWLAIARTLVVDRTCELTLLARSAPEKRLHLRSPEGVPIGSLLAPGAGISLGSDGGATSFRLVFAGHEPTFGFDLKFTFLAGAVRCRVRIVGSVDGRFRITQENWTGDLSRKGTLRIGLDPEGPLLSFRFD